MEIYSKIEIAKLNEILNGEFKMKDHGEAKIIVGMDIMRSCKQSEFLLS